MHTLFRYFSLFIICIGLTGCTFWKTTEKDAGLPAIKTAGVSVTSVSASTTIKNVALLLPLQGALGSAGQAVRDGFITAYNNDNSTDKPAHFIIIDTYNQNIIEAYRKAIKADADIVIGPLEKDNVQALTQADAISVATLALNYLDNKTPAPPKLYQFGLSPLDEARQAAVLARQNSGQNAVILAPDNNWGQTLAQAYQSEWQALGGNVVNTLLFSEDSATLNDQIHNLINAHKQKFNVILLAASPPMARQIKPLLKFYYAGDIPVYATSLVYTGTPQPAFDNDLNGVTFCDMPWTLINNAANLKLRQQIALFWPANFKQNARLYALGIDTYALVKKLPELAGNQQTIAGATGNLSLNNQRLIVRQLTCAQFANGLPDQLIPAVNSQTADDHADNDNINLNHAINIIEKAANQTNEQN